jgi:hypothetical protein
LVSSPGAEAAPAVGAAVVGAPAFGAALVGASAFGAALVGASAQGPAVIGAPARLRADTRPALALACPEVVIT